MIEIIISNLEILGIITLILSLYLLYLISPILLICLGDYFQSSKPLSKQKNQMNKSKKS